VKINVDDVIPVIVGVQYPLQIPDTTNEVEVIVPEQGKAEYVDVTVIQTDADVKRL
jgi:hypothetical protein